MILTAGSLAQSAAAHAEGTLIRSMSGCPLIAGESPVCQRVLQGDAPLGVKLHHFGKQVQGILTGLHTRLERLAAQRHALQDSTLETGSQRPCWPAAAVPGRRCQLYTGLLAFLFTHNRQPRR